MGDMELLAELRSGYPVDPAFYDLDTVTCEPYEGVVRTEATLTSRVGQRWTFDLEFVVTDPSGETHRSTTEAGVAEPGQEFSGFLLWPPEMVDLSLPCSVNVLHSTTLAFQDDETLERIHAELDRQKEEGGAG